MSNYINTIAAFLFSSELSDESNCVNDAIKLVTAIEDLIERLSSLDTSSETHELDIQTVFYDVGKHHYGTEKSELFYFFKLLYMVYFRQNAGPRWGHFINIYGVDEFIVVLETRLLNPWQVPNF